MMNHRSSPNHLGGRPSASSLRRLVSIAIGLCFVLLLGVSPAATAPGPEPEGKARNVDPTVRCEPSSVSALVGQTVSIDLYVQDVTNLYGTDMRVSFDPTIGQVVDQDTFTPGIQIQPLFSWLVPGFVIHRETHSPSNIPPNCGAWCIWYAATQTNPSPAVNGAGAVARVTFLGLQVGTFPMNWINAQLAAPGGVPITPVLTQACSVTFTAPFAVTLANFEATPQLDHVLVAWETLSETGSAGFNLYRAESASGPQTLLAYVPAQAPGSTQGFAYTYDDLSAQPGQTYWYWLEDVSLNGATTLHGPVSATIGVPVAVTLTSLHATPASPAVPAAATTLVGLAGLAAAAGVATSRRRMRQS